MAGSADIALRWASVGDAVEVAAVHIAAWKVAYAGLLPEEMLDALSVAERSAGWSEWISASLAGEPTDGPHGPSHRLIVAEVADRIVGWASFGSGRDSDARHDGELAGLYVHPDWWSHGVGATLFARVENELVTEGFRASYLWVLRDNARAVGFYTTRGWIADGGEKFLPVGDDEVILEVRHRRALSEH